MTREEAQISLAKLKRYISGGGVVDRKANEAIDMAISVLGQPKRVRGHWIVDKDNTGCTYGKCTSCGMKQYAGRTKFCPNCGARMEDK